MTYILNVQLYDRNGDPTNKYILKDLLEESEFEAEYLNEHFISDNDSIEKVSIVSVPNNNTIIIKILHNSSKESMDAYLEDFICNSAPYHSYLEVFYVDDEGYQCSMSIDNFQTLII